MKKPISTSILVATLAMLSEAGNAGYRVDIRSDEVDKTLHDEVQTALTNKEAKNQLVANYRFLSKSLTKDGVALDVGPDETLLASSADDSSGSAQCYSNCYGNCYSACYGSRGWR